MAINIGVNRAGYNMRLKYYSHIHYNDDTALKSKVEIKGLFYAKQVGGLKMENYLTSTGLKTFKSAMVLETPDLIKSLEPDDFILYAGKKWIITSIEKMPDNSVAQRGADLWRITVRS